METRMLTVSEKKLYKVLRNVGIKPNYIKKAETLDDLFLDDYDTKLLVHYFENEFDVNLKNKEIEKLTNLKAFRNFINKEKSN